MELELHQLERKYAALRVCDRRRQARLRASLSEQGQHQPVLVVAGRAAGRFVLIDGYQRVAALERLGRDTVAAVELALGEAEALLLRHRLAAEGPGSALEEGWLLQRLHEEHGIELAELATRFERSASWVHRRLGLVRWLPEPTQRQVQAGAIPPHAAMKFLLPLARANATACDELVSGIAGAQLSVRAIERIYQAWREGDAEQRARIASHPLLFLSAEEQTRADEPADPGSRSAVEAVLRDIDVVGAICRRVRRRWPHVLASRPEADVLVTVVRAWHETRLAVETLTGALEEGEAHAGRGDARSDPAPAP